MERYTIETKQGGEVVMSDPASGVTLAFVEGDASTVRTESAGRATASEVVRVTAAMTGEAYRLGLLAEADRDTVRRRAVRESVGRQVREARTRAGLTLRQLADMTGIAHNHIGRIESGRYNVTVDTLAVISAALGEEIIIG